MTNEQYLLVQWKIILYLCPKLHLQSFLFILSCFLIYKDILIWLPFIIWYILTFSSVISIRQYTLHRVKKKKKKHTHTHTHILYLNIAWNNGMDLWAQWWIKNPKLSDCVPLWLGYIILSSGKGLSIGSFEK